MEHTQNDDSEKESDRSESPVPKLPKVVYEDESEEDTSGIYFMFN